MNSPVVSEQRLVASGPGHNLLRRLDELGVTVRQVEELLQSEDGLAAVVEAVVRRGASLPTTMVSLPSACS
ncbi:MAG: hypothetical protein AAB388_01605 [Patescibacteria group bacterium]